MRTSRMLAFAPLLALTASSFGRQDPAPPELDSLPPVVVKTVPEAGSSDVDPSLTEIRVTFSKPMQDGSWSWSTAWKDSSPEFVGKPKYLDDKRTCVATVKLEPGRTYDFWLNSQKFGNFKDRDGHSAVPYLYAFKVKDAAKAKSGTKKKSGEKDGER